METETIKIRKFPQSPQNDVKCEGLHLMDHDLIRAETALEGLFDLEPYAEPEKPLKIDLNLYQLER